MYIMINKLYNHTIIHALNFVCLISQVKNGNKSGKSQGILTVCVSGNPV